MSSAQVGKTELLLNIVGYFMDHDPAPMLLLQPTLQMAEAFSKDRLAPMLRDTPSLTKKVKDPRARDSNNTLLHKAFPGGHVTLAGANSPASLASRPIRIFLADEVDRFPLSAGTEGDPLALGGKRTNNFWNRKKVYTSTPTVKGQSRIEMAYSQSDMRRYYVPCPHCENKQPLEWKNLRFDPVAYICDHCGAEIEESNKQAMLMAGEWVAEGDAGKSAGFHLSELYSPWRKWQEIIDDFKEAKKTTETLKTFINTSLGETWEEEGEQVDGHALLARREDYDGVPEEALVLVAGIDVQDDRLEMEVVGYGLGEESWSIDYVVLYGDPGRLELWNRLEEHLLKDYDGHRIKSAGLDTGGHYTQQAYQFAKKHRFVHALKGKSVAGSPIVSRPSNTNKMKVPLYGVGTDTCKELLYSRLKINEFGPGYCHYSRERDEEYFNQLTSEKRITKYVKGFPRLEWVKMRPRNEALDVRVYSMAALAILNPVFDAIARNKQPEPENEPPTPPRTTQRRRPSMRKTNWATDI